MDELRDLSRMLSTLDYCVRLDGDTIQVWKNNRAVSIKEIKHIVRENMDTYTKKVYILPAIGRYNYVVVKLR